MNNTFDTIEWTHEEDVQLGEVVLDVIANGGTVREGFEKYASLSAVRTVTASKFRFFSIVKKMDGYEERYEKAKGEGVKIRKNKKAKFKAGLVPTQKIMNEDNVITPEDFIAMTELFVKQQAENNNEKALAEKESEIQALRNKVEQLQYKLKQSDIENQDLKSQLEDKADQLKIISQAFGMINNIQENEKSPVGTYKVDKNLVVSNG